MIIYKEELDTNEENANNVEDVEVIASPKIRVAISTYYKGTSLDGALKKIEEYIDLSDENTISTL